MSALLNARWIRLLGGALAVAALAFIGWQAATLELWRLDVDLGALLAAIAVASLLYGAIQILLAYGWTTILLAFAGDPQIDRLYLLSIYGRSQIAKYLPSNVLHFAGRHYLGRRLGLSHRSLALALAMEIALMAGAAVVTAAAALGGLAIEVLDERFSSWQAGAALAGSCLLLAAIFARPAAAWLFAEQRGRLTALQGAVRLAKALCLFLAFHILAGAIYLLLIYASGAEVPRGEAAVQIIGWVALAWVVGYATLGASAGIGIREALLVVFLTPLLGAEAALVSALAYRVVTLMGDAGLFALCWLLRPRRPPPASDG
jgi:hypothetical protein